MFIPHLDISFSSVPQVRFSMRAPQRVSPMMRLLLAVKSKTLCWLPPASSTQPGCSVLTIAALAGSWITASATPSTSQALSVELGNQECTLCTLTSTRPTCLNLMPDLMHTVSEVHAWLVSTRLIYKNMYLYQSFIHHFRSLFNSNSRFWTYCK